jgi:uncharacterized membrane protein
MELRKLSHIEPHIPKLFLIFAVIISVFYAFIVPPFQVPDEPLHFFRAWQISEFNLVVDQISTKKIGGYLPESVKQITAQLEHVARYVDQKVTTSDFETLFSIQLNERKKTFVTFPTTAWYTPIVYLPQATAILLGRLANFPPIVIFYMARVAALLFSALLIYISIAIVPVARAGYMFLALSPMVLFESAAISADGVTLGIASLFISYCLHLALQDKLATLRNLCILVALSWALAQCKVVYGTMLLAVLAVHPRHFGGMKKWCFWMAAIFAGSLAIVLIWASFVRGIPVETAGDCNASEQLQNLLSKPLGYLTVLKSTIQKNFSFYTETFVGTFGWLDTPLSTKAFNTYLWALPLLALTSKDGKNPSKQVLATFNMAFLLSVLSVFTALYLSFTYVAAPTVNGVQGRYFLPIAGLFLINFRLLPIGFIKPTITEVLALLVALYVNIHALNDIFQRFYL